MDEAARTRMRTGAAARTKAVGKDGGRGQRGRNVARVSLLGEVHRRHDGTPSSSGEGMRHEGHHVSSHLFIFCVKALILTNLVIYLFLFSYS